MTKKIKQPASRAGGTIEVTDADLRAAVDAAPWKSTATDLEYALRDLQNAATALQLGEDAEDEGNACGGGARRWATEQLVDVIIPRVRDLFFKLHDQMPKGPSMVDMAVARQAKGGHANA